MLCDFSVETRSLSPSFLDIPASAMVCIEGARELEARVFDMQELWTFAGRSCVFFENVQRARVAFFGQSDFGLLEGGAVFVMRAGFIDPFQMWGPFGSFRGKVEWHSPAAVHCSRVVFGDQQPGNSAVFLCGDIY